MVRVAAACDGLDGYSVTGNKDLLVRRIPFQYMEDPSPDGGHFLPFLCLRRMRSAACQIFLVRPPGGLVVHVDIALISQPFVQIGLDFEVRPQFL